MQDQDILDIAQLIWNKWSKTVDALTRVADEKPDKSEPDWKEFHRTRMLNATNDEEYWSHLKQRFIDEHRDVINRSYGI